MNIFDVWPLVLMSLKDAWVLNWGELVYRQETQVIRTAAFLAAVFFAVLLIKRWRNKKNRDWGSNSHYLTGLVINNRHGHGITYKLVRGFTWILVFSSLCFLGVALADPVMVFTNTTEQIESREIIYIKDVSASNGFHLPNSKVARGELAKETLDRIVLKRRERMDRAAYIVFGTQSEIWSGFTTNYESLAFSVLMSPIAIAPATAQVMWGENFVLKKGQFVEHDNGGKTNLHLGLESAIYLFDRKSSPKIVEELKRDPNAQMRSVVIITDGAADVDPEPQLEELHKMRVIPYLVFIDLDRTIERMLFGENSIQVKLPDRLLMMIRRYGGQYFLAKDRQSVDRISEELDKLQSMKIAKLVNTKEEDVYFIPLAVAFLFAIAATTVRFLSLLMWRTV